MNKGGFTDGILAGLFIAALVIVLGLFIVLEFDL